MEARLLRAFCVWVLNVEWDDARRMIYPLNSHPDYLAEKERIFNHSKLQWMCALDPTNRQKIWDRIKEICNGQA